MTSDMVAARPALAVGDRLPSRQVGPLTRSDIARYAGAGGDFIPLHTDEEFAKENGFPTVFAMGLLGAGVLAQALAGWVGLPYVRAYSVRFTGQVWPGDVLSVDGVVERIDDGDGNERHAHVKLALQRQTGESALIGSAVVAVA